LNIEYYLIIYRIGTISGALYCIYSFKRSSDDKGNCAFMPSLITPIILTKLKATYGYTISYEVPYHVFPWNCWINGETAW